MPCGAFQEQAICFSSHAPGGRKTRDPGSNEIVSEL